MTAPEDLFARYRSELVMDPEARARSLRKLQERLARGEQPAPEIEVAPPKVSMRWLSRATLGWIGGALGLIGGVVWVGQGDVVQPMAAAVADAPVSRSEPQLDVVLPPLAAAEPVVEVPPQAAAAPKRSARRRTPAAARAESAPPPAAAETSRADASQLVAAAPSPNKPARAAREPAADKLPERAAETPASGALAKELKLLQAAQLALRAGDTRRALSLLAEHTWEFPRGQLAEARDVARILALCQAGEVAQSKQDAQRFLQQRPQSPYALRVREGCSAKP